MTGCFSFLRHPDRFKPYFREYPYGVHRDHAVAHLLAVVVFKINDGLIDESPGRHTPRVTLPRYRQAKRQCVLAVSLGKRQQRVPIAFANKDLILGDRWIALDDAEGPMRLVNAVVDLIEEFWKTNGR